MRWIDSDYFEKNEAVMSFWSTRCEKKVYVGKALDTDRRRLYCLLNYILKAAAWPYSACTPDKDGSRVEVEVEHMFFFETDVTAEVLANDALPSWEKCLIEKLLKVLGQVDILEFTLPSHSLLHELNGFQSHVFQKEKNNQLIRVANFAFATYPLRYCIFQCEFFCLPFINQAIKLCEI